MYHVQISEHEHRTDATRTQQEPTTTARGKTLRLHAPNPLLGTTCFMKPSIEATETLENTSTQGLQCSSFLVMTYFLLRDYNIQPKTELHWSPWVDTCAETENDHLRQPELQLKRYVDRSVLQVDTPHPSTCLKAVTSKPPASISIKTRICPALNRNFFCTATVPESPRRFC